MSGWIQAPMQKNTMVSIPKITKDAKNIIVFE